MPRPVLNYSGVSEWALLGTYACKRPVQCIEVKGTVYSVLKFVNPGLPCAFAAPFILFPADSERNSIDFNHSMECSVEIEYCLPVVITDLSHH